MRHESGTASATSAAATGRKSGRRLTKNLPAGAAVGIGARKRAEAGVVNKRKKLPEENPVEGDLEAVAEVGAGAPNEGQEVEEEGQVGKGEEVAHGLEDQEIEEETAEHEIEIEIAYRRAT